MRRKTRGVSKKEAALWAAFALAALFLGLKNLGEVCLWQDEAETAVLARNTLEYGVPKAFDGRNLVSQNRGADLDGELVFNYRPWLDIYTAAASFLVLGESTFTARLPFVLLGLAALLLVRRQALRWSGSRLVADATMWLTLLSVPYLLLIRQCRYYALIPFFAFCMYAAYEAFLDRKPRSVPWLVLSGAGMFHASYLMFFAVAGTLTAHFLLLARKDKVLWRRAWAAAGASAALALPFIVYLRVFSRALAEGPGWLGTVASNAGYYARAVDVHVFPLLALPVLLLDRGSLSRMKRPLAYLLCGLFFLTVSTRHYFRYLIFLIPLFNFVLLESARALGRRSRAAAAVFLGLALLTHALSPSYWAGRGGGFLRTDRLDYLHEITHRFDEPLKTVAGYLCGHARTGDILFVTYPDLPFMFYTPLKVIGGGSGMRRIPVRRLRWAAVRDPSEESFIPLREDFVRVRISAPDRPWGNRPDPDLHSYRSREAVPIGFFVRPAASPSAASP